MLKMGLVYLDGKKENCEGEIKEDYYDQVLCKESWFWAPIREWEKKMGFVTPIVWTNLFFIFLLHASVFAHTYYFFANGNRILTSTVVFAMAYYIFAGFGITAGIHRYWSHKAFKATPLVKVLMLLGYAAAGQVPIRDWVRDHRVHHKRSETSADPHDATRGFFFAHVGWLMMKKHPHVLAEGAKVDMSDITGDPWIVLFDRHFTILKIIWCFLIPTIIPIMLFGESVSAAIIPTMVRYLILLNGTWSVNSFAHFFGHRPYNKNIKPSENFGVSLFTMGEGSHNFHHTFPWDYRSTETPLFNLTTMILNTLVALGLVYDMRVASNKLIKSTIEKYGGSKL